MEEVADSGKLSSIQVDSELVRPIVKRKYPRNMQSELIQRRTELKIIQLDQQVINSGSANIINLEFAEENATLFRRTNRRIKRNSAGEERKSISTQKEVPRNRYHELFKGSVDYFCKNTMQIGPCAKSILAQTELTDLYARRRLINIEKLTFPYRSSKRDSTAKQKYRTMISKSERTHSKEDDFHKGKSLSEVEQEVNRSSRKLNETQPMLENLFFQKKELKPDYKKEISTLIPIRKPSSKKDYFVFGLSDRNNSTDNKIELYRDLLWKINYSNGLYVCTPDSLAQPYKFYVGEGNNSNLIKGIMRRRFWWIQAGNKTEEGINFVWTQLKMNSFFPTQETAEISEYFVAERIQSELFGDGSTSCRWTEGDSHKKLFGRLDFKIWKKHFQKNEKTQKKINQHTYQKRINMYEKKKILKINDSHAIKIHNHLESNFYIGNKKAIYYNLKRYLEIKGEEPFDTLPLTFHIKKGVQDPEYQHFLKFYKYFEEEKLEKKQIKNIWIVKPGQNTNRGNGITVCYSLDDIKLRLKGRERNGDGKLRTFILQKYIQNPLLYNKRKFDMRHYILITCINGSFKGYWFEEGYVRTSSSEFNLKPGKDAQIHLTNDAIQKNLPEYGKYQKGNKLSYADLHKYLETAYPSRKYNFLEHMLPKMKHIAAESIKATYFLLDPARRKSNFELLGLDFMIDEDFHPWLIEINTNPCLQLSCPLLQRIIPSVIENTFKICVDPLFPPPQIWPNNRKLFFGDDPLSENKYEIIFDENSDGKDIERLFAGKDKLDSTIGKIEQDDETFQNEGELQWEGQKP